MQGLKRSFKRKFDRGRFARPFKGYAIIREVRITEAGDPRITEDENTRVTEKSTT